MDELKELIQTGFDDLRDIITAGDRQIQLLTGKVNTIEQKVEHLTSVVQGDLHRLPINERLLIVETELTDLKKDKNSRNEKGWQVAVLILSPILAAVVSYFMGIAK